MSLHHFTHPAWLGEEFWLDDDSPSDSPRHVARVVPALAPVPAVGHHQRAEHRGPDGLGRGAYPPGRQMARCRRLRRAGQPPHRPRARLSGHPPAAAGGRGDGQHQFLLALRARPAAHRPAHGPGRRGGSAGLDAWVDERRALHDDLFPPQAVGESSPPAVRGGVAYGDRPGGRRSTGPSARACRRTPAAWSSTPSTKSPRPPRPLDATGFDWYDPVASHATRLPGHRPPAAGTGSRPGPSGTSPDPAPSPGGVETRATAPGLPLWVVENGLCNRVHNGRSYPRLDGWNRPRYLREHIAAVVDAVAAGGAGHRLPPLVPGRQLRVGQLRAPIRHLRHRPRPGPGGFRWLDTDAEGRDSAGAYRQFIAWARQGAEGTPPGPTRPDERRSGSPPAPSPGSAG